MTTKIYAARDSATSALRKLGIQARDYNFFITKVGDKFECKLGAAAAHLESLKNPKPVVQSPGLRNPGDVFGSAMNAAKRHEEVKPTAKAPKTPKHDVEVVTISSVARAMILDGKTNQEVWAAIKQQFNLDDSKKHYPTWYRCEMGRKGLLPK